MNESLVAIPANVSEDSEVLQRFLIRLVEELDLVLGLRGDDGLVRQSELSSAAESITSQTSTTLASVATALEELTTVVEGIVETATDENTTVAEQLAELTARVEDLEILTSTHTATLADHEARIAALEAAP